MIVTYLLSFLLLLFVVNMIREDAAALAVSRQDEGELLLNLHWKNQ